MLLLNNLFGFYFIIFKLIFLMVKNFIVAAC